MVSTVRDYHVGDGAAKIDAWPAPWAQRQSSGCDQRGDRASYQQSKTLFSSSEQPR